MHQTSINTFSCLCFTRTKNTRRGQQILLYFHTLKHERRLLRPFNLLEDAPGSGFEIYKSVEDKVRRAVELDNRLDILMERGYASEVTKMRFRVRQLTGLDDIESKIDELI